MRGYFDGRCAVEMVESMRQRLFLMRPFRVCCVSSLWWMSGVPTHSPRSSRQPTLGSNKVKHTQTQAQATHFGKAIYTHPVCLRARSGTRRVYARACKCVSVCVCFQPTNINAHAFARRMMRGKREIALARSLAQKAMAALVAEHMCLRSKHASHVLARYTPTLRGIRIRISGKPGPPNWRTHTASAQTLRDAFAIVIIIEPFRVWCSTSTTNHYHTLLNTHSYLYEDATCMAGSLSARNCAPSGRRRTRESEIMTWSV